MKPLLLVVLLCTPATAQNDRPSLSVPEPTRKHSTPRPEGDYTIIHVDYNDAIKGRDYISMATQELVSYASMAAKLKVQLNWRTLSLDHPRIIGALMLYMTGSDGALRLNDAEKQGLAQYLRQGGFLYAEDIMPLETNIRTLNGGVAGTPFDRQFKALLKDPKVLSNQGGRWRKIPKNDPIYSSYFDFPDGPPMNGAPYGNVFALEALELRGRTAVVFSDLNISWFWGNRDADGRDRNLQFGTNLVVFALTKQFAGRPLPVGR